MIGRSDEQILQQYQDEPSELNVEELLYGANLQTNEQLRKQWYEKITKIYPQDERAFNNLAKIAYQNGDINTATTYLKKAKSLNPNSPEVAANEALLALANGDIDKAEMSLAKGTTADTYTEILGNLNMAKGNYAAAESNLSGVYTNSAALAQIMNKDYAAATTTLANISNADAYTSYLRAILAARQNEANQVVSNLKEAIRLNPNLAARAAKDLEFAKYAAQIAGLVK